MNGVDFIVSYAPKMWKEMVVELKSQRCAMEQIVQELEKFNENLSKMNNEKN